MNIHTVTLSASIYNTLRVMSEARKIHTVLLTFEFLCVLALFAIVDLQSFVVTRDKCQLARIVKVYGCD